MENQSELSSEIQKSTTRGKILLVLLVLCVVSDIGGLAAGFSQLHLLNRIKDGVEISDSHADLNDLLYGVVGLVQTFLFFITAVVWLVWLKKAYGNLKLVGSQQSKFSPGWAVGYWFVPFINLVRPYQIMKELWNRSENANEDDDEPNVTPSVIPLWWASWIISGFIGRLMFRQSMSADDLSSFLVSTKTGMINDSATILAGVLALIMVSHIHGRQKLFSSPIQEESTIQPSPAISPR